VKAVFLAGGFGTRLSEETAVRPKPMVEIGGRPILWHIMKLYSAHGVNDFVICLGYKAEVVKDFFLNYHVRAADLTVHVAEDRVEIHDAAAVEPWRVTLVHTGDDTMTGGRLKRIAPIVGDETFCFAYGDCVSDVDIGRLLAHHREQGVLATLTAIRPPGRFGALALGDRDRIETFREKPEGQGGWVNGGFFVLEPGVFDYIEGDGTVWEREPLERLAADGQLAAYRHAGYWQNMDSLRDKIVLEEQWASGSPKWKVW
jgi:glucose-1-phosphate cytidylyltransferase